MANRDVGKAVRLPASTHEQLAAAAAKQGVSIGLLADGLILRGLAGPTSSTVLRTRALATSARATPALESSEPCRHPVNRRIGAQCALCGATTLSAAR